LSANKLLGWCSDCASSLCKSKSVSTDYDWAWPTMSFKNVLTPKLQHCQSGAAVDATMTSHPTQRTQTWTSDCCCHPYFLDCCRSMEHSPRGLESPINSFQDHLLLGPPSFPSNSSSKDVWLSNFSQSSHFLTTVGIGEQDIFVTCCLCLPQLLGALICHFMYLHSRHTKQGYWEFLLEFFLLGVQNRCDMTQKLNTVGLFFLLLFGFFWTGNDSVGWPVLSFWRALLIRMGSGMLVTVHSARTIGFSFLIACTADFPVISPLGCLQKQSQRSPMNAQL